MKIKSSFVCAAAFCAAFSAFPRGAAASRPFLTEDAGTTPVAVAGVELGFDYKDPSGDITAGLAPYMGISDSAEIYLEAPFNIKGDDSWKIDTFGAGAKWNLFRAGEEQLFTLAFNVSGLPKESSALSYTAAAVVSKEMGPLTAHTNLGGVFSSEKFENYVWGAALEAPLADSAALCGEIHSEMTLFDKAFDDNHVTAMGGIKWSPAKNMTLDASVRLPLTAAAKALEASGEPSEKAHYVLGVTYEF